MTILHSLLHQDQLLQCPVISLLQNRWDHIWKIRTFVLTLSQSVTAPDHDWSHLAGQMVVMTFSLKIRSELEFLLNDMEPHE